MKISAMTSALILVGMTSMAGAQGTGQDHPAERRDPGSLSAGQKQVTPSTRDRGENTPGAPTGSSSSGMSTGEQGSPAGPGAGPTGTAPGGTKGMGSGPGSR